jgi:hypothetical protein
VLGLGGAYTFWKNLRKDKAWDPKDHYPRNAGIIFGISIMMIGWLSAPAFYRGMKSLVAESVNRCASESWVCSVRTIADLFNGHFFEDVLISTAGLVIAALILISSAASRLVCAFIATFHNHAHDAGKRTTVPRSVVRRTLTNTLKEPWTLAMLGSQAIAFIVCIFYSQGWFLPDQNTPGIAVICLTLYEVLIFGFIVALRGQMSPAILALIPLLSVAALGTGLLGHATRLSHDLIGIDWNDDAGEITYIKQILFMALFQAVMFHLVLFRKSGFDRGFAVMLMAICGMTVSVYHLAPSLISWPDMMHLPPIFFDELSAYVAQEVATTGHLPSCPSPMPAGLTCHEIPHGSSFPSTPELAGNGIVAEIRENWGDGYYGSLPINLYFFAPDWSYAPPIYSVGGYFTEGGRSLLISTNIHMDAVTVYNNAFGWSVSTVCIVWLMTWQIARNFHKVRNTSHV